MLKNRIEYGVILLVAVLLFLFYHNFFFFYLLLAAVLLAVISFSVSKKAFNGIEVKVNIPLGTVGSNNDIPVDFIIENSTPFPMPGVRLGYKVENGFYPNEEKQEMTLPVRRGTHSFRWKISSVYSGLVTLTGKSLKMQDYLGLFVFEREWGADARITVLPNADDIVMNIVENAFAEGDESDTDSALTSEDVTQVKEFREYAPGDRMQRVNWKISAKYDDLYVKEFERLYDRTLALLVELRRDSEEAGFLDELITAFYSAAIKLIELEIPFKVQWYDTKQSRFCEENVNDEDGLLDALNQIFMMQSYTGYEAYEKYSGAPKRAGDSAVYFTTPGFSGISDTNRLGNYKDKVVLIWLQ